MKGKTMRKKLTELWKRLDAWVQKASFGQLVLFSIILFVVVVGILAIPFALTWPASMEALFYVIVAIAGLGTVVILMWIIGKV